MYKNYIFGVYGTLIDILTNEHELETWQKLADTLKFYGINYGAQELRDTYFASCDLQMQQGKSATPHPEVDVVEVFCHLFANKGKKVGKSLAMHLAQEFRAFSTLHIALYDGVIETLTKLKKAGKKLYLVTNAQSCYAKTEINRLGLRRFFSGVVYSSDCKCRKPDAKIFEAVIKKHNLNKKETVVVGNDEDDVLGARNAKLDCLWIKTNLTEQTETTVSPKYTVADGNFREVARILLQKNQ